jgi:hypothetical protein
MAIMVVLSPTGPTDPKGAVGILWSGKSDSEEVSPADKNCACGLALSAYVTILRLLHNFQKLRQFAAVRRR